MSERQEPEGPLRLLSLDGGGIRGLSELVILEEMMERIKLKLGLPETPLPCDYFDMIGGTSTGGLIALMLGRLGMPPHEAIERYEKLAETVFTDMKIIGEGRFKATKLEEVIKAIVKDKTGGTEELIMNPSFGGRQCKTFVCAMSAHDITSRNPYLFRSYQPPKNRTTNCTIWEAARATSAAPTFFKQITIGGQDYIDGGLGCNNPAKQVLKEAQLIFPGRPIACLISIGTGQARVIEIPRPNWFQQILPLDVITALQGMATDCEATAQEIAGDYRDTPNVYFRFNVDRGMHNIGLGEWEKLKGVKAYTVTYLRMEEGDQKLDSAIEVIQQRLTAAAIPGLVPELELARPPAQYMRMVEMDERLSGDALATQRRTKTVAVSGPEPSKTTIEYSPFYSTGFDHEPRDEVENKEYYRGIVPRELQNRYQLAVGNGTLSIEFDGLGPGPIHWSSFLNAAFEPEGPVCVEANIDLSRWNTTESPGGAGVLVILPNERKDGKTYKFYFIVEPSEPVPQLHVLKRKKLGDSLAFRPLRSEALLHCQGQQNVQVKVTVLDGTIEVSTNGVISAILPMPTSGGPKRLRGFGLCGIGSRRLTWTSFKVSLGHDQPPHGPSTDSDQEAQDLEMAIKRSLQTPI